MTEETKKQLLALAEMNKLDEGVILTELTQSRDTLYFVLKSTITEIIDYDNSDLDDEEKIDRLFNQKELIERRIQSLNLIIKKLADQILENQITEGDNNE